MIDDEARDYAGKVGALVMLYPPEIIGRPDGFSNVWPLQFFKFQNEQMIIDMKDTFGAHRWPSMA